MCSLVEWYQWDVGKHRPGKHQSASHSICWRDHWIVGHFFRFNTDRKKVNRCFHKGWGI